jgi:hypothetical protein
MRRSYVAYGLRLRSRFALAGMKPGGPQQELPELVLDLVAPEQLEQAWDAARGSSLWRGRLGDGAPLALERGPNGDLLFSYGERARFRLLASFGSLQCAPRENGLAWQRVLLGKVLPSVSVLRGREALHAAAVRSPAGVVAILGASGTGKSTLALEFVRRGWSLFADDALALSAEGSVLRAHPGTPHLSVDDREPGSARAGELWSTLARMHGERWLSVRPHGWQPGSVRVLCLLRRHAVAHCDARALPANPLLLAPYMLGLRGDATRQRRRFDLFADLVGSARLWQVRRGAQATAAELADVIEHALVCPPVPAGPRARSSTRARARAIVPRPLGAPG